MKKYMIFLLFLVGVVCHAESVFSSCTNKFYPVTGEFKDYFFTSKIMVPFEMPDTTQKQIKRKIPESIFFRSFSKYNPTIGLGVSLSVELFNNDMSFIDIAASKDFCNKPNFKNNYYLLNKIYKKTVAIFWYKYGTDRFDVNGVLIITPRKDKKIAFRYEFINLSDSRSKGEKFINSELQYFLLDTPFFEATVIE